MCEQSEVDYLDGDVVWVKLGSCWWPGEVVGPEKLPPDVLPSFRKPPIAVVKFFQENTYEYVKNISAIYKYNCSRKNEFINKGLYMYRTKHGHMEKFPEDVIRAETAVGGDKEILTRDEFQEVKKESYAGIFGGGRKSTPASVKKGRGRGRPSESPKEQSTPVRKFYKDKSDYKVHILLQPTKESEPVAEPVSSQSTSHADSETVDDKPEKQEKPQPQTPTVSTPTAPGTYACHVCPFTTTRLNVLVLHNKTHSSTFTTYTPSPVRKKHTLKSQTKPVSKTPKTSRVRKEKSPKVPKKASQSKKRAAGDHATAEVKKPKTDQEIKSSLLADWDDDAEEESNDESTDVVATGSPEVPARSESPAVPTPADLPGGETSREVSSPEKKSDEVSEKPESSSDSKYEFCEDEDWPEEADAGRKIPRVKNPSKRKEDTKSLSLEDDDVAREVAELLNKTSVPELPSVPEPLKVEENFPEPSVVKSPDKKNDSPQETSKVLEKPLEPKPTIFKTKTFFRSRHSRSQDAIGKYVAEQLNAERIDTLESDINGSEAVSSPETRESPPVDHVKVARLAPKIQLKKMKAEAAQLKEKVKTAANKSDITNNLKFNNMDIEPTDSTDFEVLTKTMQDVIYPTQEIKPINKDLKIKELQLDTDHDKNENTSTGPQETIQNSSELSTALSIDIDESVINETSQSYTPESINSHTNNASNDITKHSQGLNFMIKDTNAENTELSKVDLISEKSQEMPVEPACSPKKFTPKTHVTSPKPKAFLQEAQNSLVKLEEINSSPIKTSVQKTYEQLMEPFMTESTASAVDALLSVSREADRVPRVVGSGPPEDLFEDDNKDTNEQVAAESMIVDESYNTHNKEISTDSITDLNGLTEQTTEIKCTAMEIETTLDNVSISEEHKTSTDNMPSESDLQIAETLLNLPSTAIKNIASEQVDNVVPMVVEDQQLDDIVTETIVETENSEDSVTNDVTSDVVANDNKDLKTRYETELEKSENLNAAKSLVEMSESMDHKMNVESNSVTQELPKEPYKSIQNNGTNSASPIKKVENEIPKDSTKELLPSKITKFDNSSSKLLKILEEPPAPKSLPTKITPVKKPITTKQVIVTGKEKILNFDVANAALKKQQTPKQKIIIRRTGSGKSFLNNLGDVVASPDKIILSRSNISGQDGSSVQTFTIQSSPDIATSTDAKQIIIQPKLRKVTKPQTKVHCIKSQNSLMQWSENKTSSETIVQEDAIFDINSMPIVLSEDILTPESIEKMPIVMSDGNLMTNSSTNPPKLMKSVKPVLDNEKVHITSAPSKHEVKTIVVNPSNDVNKVTTPNILSKSAKLRGAKPMLVIDKATGKQKIIMTKGEPPVKEIKPAQTIIQPTLQPIAQTTSKAEKFIILPSSGSPRPARAQKIVIDPQTGKAHMLVAKGQDTQINVPENKPVSAKLIPSSSETGSPGTGNTVMIITNAQGGQSRIVLTPEHEKILFPNKQHGNLSQLKTITQHRMTTPATIVQKTVVTAASHAKAPAKIVPKQQKSAIITSKGQLIVGGRVTTTAQNIAPVPEIRPAHKSEFRTITKRPVTSETKKIVQTVQKNTTEPLIFLQQKSGAVVQLTAAQFEHLQRTGQIVQKQPPPVENKIVVQKSITISPKDNLQPIVQKQQRVRKSAIASPSPAKKLKQQQPALMPIVTPSITPMLSLTSISHTVSTVTSSLPSSVPSVSETVSISTTGGYPELENYEELLPSSSIIRPQPEPSTPASIPQPELVVNQPEIVVNQPEPVVEPPPAQLSDGQLLAVPGENFGGPAGSFYLCVEDNGTLTPIDNRPLVLENNQLVPMAIETLPVFAPQPERRDILEAALANSDVFHADAGRDEAPDFRDLNANVSVHCRVSETSTTLNQPIMTPVEVPTNVDSEPAVPSNLEDGLAVIGVTPHTVPTSLELPITVTDPRIAPKTTDPLSGNNYGATLLPSPNAELTFATSEEPISMPLLSEPEPTAGKSMPILTDEAASSAPESPASPSLRLRTPASDASDASPSSAEIPLQPALQLHLDRLDRAS